MKKEIAELPRRANQGSSDAQNSLGVMYQNGIGVAKDYAQAVKWYMKSAENFNSAAEYNLGLMYKNGLGVTKDYAQAVRWFTSAHIHGNSLAGKELQTLRATSAR